MYILTILCFISKVTYDSFVKVNLLVSQIREYCRFFDTAVFRTYIYFFTSLLFVISQDLDSNRSFQGSHPECLKLTCSVCFT